MGTRALRLHGRAYSFRGITDGRPDLADVDTEDPSFLQEATVPMSSETHAGEDVPIYATGARAALFHGVREQTTSTTRWWRRSAGRGAASRTDR